MKLARAAAGVFAMSAVGCAVDACSLTTTLDGLSTASAETQLPILDASPQTDSSSGSSGSSGGPEGGTTVTSCAALKQASPATPDGFQTIDPDGPGGPIAPFNAWCDMTNDGGGWMLVSAALVADETNVGATVVRTTDDHGGLILRAYVNNPGCGSSPPTRYRFYIHDWPKWSRVRLRQTFAGRASCWHIWGALENNAPLAPNLAPFNPSADIVRDAVRMGGLNGDAFDGVPKRCDSDNANFWDKGTASLRSAVVLLRRQDAATPSGLATGADCGDYSAGTTSPLWWEYRDIYVK